MAVQTRPAGSHTQETRTTGAHSVVETKLCQQLIENGKLTLERATAICEQPNSSESAGRPGWRLVVAGVLTEQEWTERIGDLFGLAAASLEDFTVDRDLVKEVPEDLARKHHLLPISNSGAEVYIATTNPTNIAIFDHLRSLLGAPVQPVIIPPSELEKAYQRYYVDVDISDLEHVESSPESLSEAELAQLRDGGEDAQVVTLVDRILAHAIGTGASDIHVEPFADRLEVRFRVDGRLREGPSYPAGISPWIVSRIKVLAMLDIAERFVPQDGRVRLRKQGRDIDMRVSCLPVVHGEKVVIRLLGHGNLRPIEDIGFPADDVAHIKRELARPQGMFLVTGPTGSGKSTTLYACLGESASPEINVTTVEDPVEYEVRGLNQVPINPKRGLTFAGALRSILRQDPDVILVGEIRDKETGIIASEAALTGHLLLSTLHTNTAAGAVHRLLQMGVPRHMLAPSLNAVLAQRLVRRLCEDCAVLYSPQPDEFSDIVPGLRVQGVQLRAPTGCGECDGTGYNGRLLVHELLLVTDEIRDLISDGGTTVQIAKAARKSGAKTMAERTLERVFAGETSREELRRVVTG